MGTCENSIKIKQPSHFPLISGVERGTIFTQRIVFLEFAEFRRFLEYFLVPWLPCLVR
jgi:hypothetical protein